MAPIVSPLPTRSTLALDPRPLLPQGRRIVRRMSHAVRCGFPSPADDYIQDVLDLNRHLIVQGHEDSTFILRVEGHSMIKAGIHHGDEVMVDRALAPKHGVVVVAVVNGELTIKFLHFREGKPVLVAGNPHFADRIFAEGEELIIWGVVTRVLHRV